MRILKWLLITHITIAWRLSRANARARDVCWRSSFYRFNLWLLLKFLIAIGVNQRSKAHDRRVRREFAKLSHKYRNRDLEEHYGGVD